MTDLLMTPPSAGSPRVGPSWQFVFFSLGGRGLTGVDVQGGVPAPGMLGFPFSYIRN